MTGRFDRLEGQGLPGPLKEAVARLSRFERLEIGESAPAKEAAEAPSGRLCAHCGHANEPERETCWACYKPVAAAPKKAAAPDDITIVLDGFTYRSSDKDLAPDVRELMDRIRKRGFSQELLLEWRDWRLTRASKKLREEPEREVKVFKGQRVSVISIDGKVFTSDAKDLSPEMKELFSYIDANGVTPELMEHLRGAGPSVKLRPANTVQPSDGDLEFWKRVEKTGDAAAAGPPPMWAGQKAALCLAAAAALLLLTRAC